MNDVPDIGRWRIVLAFAALYIVWGSTYLAALIGLGGLPVYILLAMRFFIAGLILYSWVRFKREPNPGWPVVRAHGFSGILMLVGGTGSVVWSEQYLPTGIAAIFVAALPIWFLLLDKTQWKNYLRNKLIVSGIIVGFGGILFLMGRQKTTVAGVYNPHMQSVSMAVLTGGCIAWAAGSLYSRKIQSNSTTIMIVSMQLLAAGFFAFLLSLALGEWNGFSLYQVPLKAWLALVYMVIMGSVITYVAYIWLLTVRPAVQVGTYAYANPVIAVMLGWGFAGEQITARQLVSLIAIATGVLLINLPKYKSLKHD